MEVVAFGPPVAEPNCPTILVVRDGSVLLKANRGEAPSSEVSLAQLMASGEASRLDTPIPWKPGHWLVMDGGPKWIANHELDRWRQDQAKNLISQAATFKGDPERQIAIFKMAARVADVPIESLISRLESARNFPEERLEDVYARLKNLKQ